MHSDSCVLSLRTPLNRGTDRVFGDLLAQCLETFCAVRTSGRPLFPLVPLPASAFLSHSDLASVRANEVLDGLTVPDYGHSHPARSNWGSSSCSIPGNTQQP